MGIKSDDEPDDHEIYVGFKWFADLHAVMRTRAVVSPPALLDTSTPDTSAVDNQVTSDQQLDPDGEQPNESEQAQIDSDQPQLPGSSAVVPGPTPPSSSATVTGTSAAAGSSTTASGPSTSGDSATASGPSTSGSSATASAPSTSGNTTQPPEKKRKTKVEKMENLFEKFAAQQEMVQKDAREMEQKRIELEERQAQREEQRDMQFMMLLHELCSTGNPAPVAPTVATHPYYPPMYSFPNPPPQHDEEDGYDQ